jgi:membrane protein DedA with SNARE-associated domain
VTHFLQQYGLPSLFVVVMIESFGVPLPGETLLIAFGVLAARGQYSIVWVIAVAAAAAIVGDNLGYWLIGRVGGRTLFARWRWLNRYSARELPRAEALMNRHGAKVVFFARFITVLRFTAAWVAGLSRMAWWRFLLWNAAGGIAWATLVGLSTYYAGKAAADTISQLQVRSCCSPCASGADRPRGRPRSRACVPRRRAAARCSGADRR